MEISTYKHILAIAKYGSIAKAAEYLFISRTSLNRQLIALEDELGTKLFKRVSNTLVLTYTGRIFLEAAVKIIAEDKESRNLIEDITGGHCGRIFVGIPISWSNILLAETMAEFKELYPNVSVELTLAPSNALVKYLEKGGVDIAILSESELCSNFSYEDIIMAEYLVMVPKSHQYAAQAGDCDGNRRGCDFEWFKNDGWAFEAPGTKGRKLCDRLFSQLKYDPNILVENCIYSLQMKMVNAGVCNTIALDMLLPQYNNIAAFSLSPRYFFNLVAARRSDYKRSKPEKAFIEIIRSTAKRRY